MKAINILCEYLDNPIGIEIKKPRITWNLDEGKLQYGFRIYGKIDNEDFDTGFLKTTSMHFDFKEDLKAKARVEYRVRIFTDENNYLDSEVKFFEEGTYEGIKAKWISGNYQAKKGKRYPADYFHKSFVVKNFHKARLYITALGLYEVSINQKRVGNNYFTPGSTDYRKRVEYQTYDVKDLLNTGNNDINIILGDGWYRGSNGSKGRTNTYGIISKVIMRLEIEEDGGTQSVIISDDSFDWSNDGPIKFNDLKDGEVVDEKLVPSYKEKAKVVKFKANITALNPIITSEHETFKPLRLITTPKGKKVLEFPQNLSGYLSFKINGKSGDKIILRLGELIDHEGEFTQKNIQCIRKGKRTPLQQITVYLKEGVNEYKSKFFFGGFRYVLVESDVLFQMNDFTAIAVYSSMPITSSFNCSNPLINTFYQNSLWSLKSNSLSIPTDCPTRERMGWTGDSQVFFNTASYLSNYASFIKKHLCDLFDRQWKNGKLAQIVPYANEDWFMNFMNGSVGWADAGILIPYRFFKKYGDDRILFEYYKRMKKYCHFMIGRAGKWGGVYSKPLNLSLKNRKYGVNRGQSYGEWAEPHDVMAFNWIDFASPHPEESTAYTSYVLGIMLEIMNILNKKDDSDYLLFMKYHEGCKKAYQEMVEKKEFSLDTDRQAKLVRPLYMHLLTDTQEEYAKKRLIQAVKNYGYRLGTGFLSTPFILEVLQGIDKNTCFKLLENEEMPGWLFMAKHNTTSIWEDWEGPEAKDAGLASLNHYSKGALTEWLISRLLGIRIKGENEFEIEPILGGHITEASGSYDSIYGKVSVKEEKIQNKIHISISIPANTKGTIILPDSVIQELGYGTYNFSCEE